MNEDSNLHQPVIANPPGNPPLALMVRIKLHGAPPPANPKTRFDIHADPNGEVAPNSGGMSVSRSWDDLPPFSIPRRLRRAHPSQNFRGASGGPTCKIWSHSVPAGFAAAAAPPVAFGADLMLRVDAPGHGLIEPDKRMLHTAYESAIVGTRAVWSVDEPPAPQLAAPGATPSAPITRPSMPSGGPKP